MFTPGHRAWCRLKQPGVTRRSPLSRGHPRCPPRVRRACGRLQHVGGAPWLGPEPEAAWFSPACWSASWPRCSRRSTC